jgi:hypothetical protein
MSTDRIGEADVRSFEDLRNFRAQNVLETELNQLGELHKMCIRLAASLPGFDACDGVDTVPLS